MSNSAELEFLPQAVGNADRPEDIVTLGPDDFQRIGIQPKETRLAVIRRAASRAAKSLARRQLSAPNSLTEQQLSRIAVSTYRLLDPRQREDRLSRAHVGRIRPATLYRAGRTEFCDGKILIQSCESSESSVATHHVNEVCHRDHPDDEPASMEIQPSTGSPRASADVLTRLRRQATRPSLILVMISALLLTVGAFWFWGQSPPPGPSRAIPAASER